MEEFLTIMLKEHDERAKLKDMEKIAEGGIEFLMEQRLGDSIPDIAKVIQLIREPS